VPDNVREDGFKPVRRKVPQRIYRLAVVAAGWRIPTSGIGGAVRVKRCGKSAPPRQ